MSEQPFYVVFAGVNGAGKSTLFRSDFWHTGGMPATMARVNPDEILREQGGDWSNGQDQVAAGRIALRSVVRFICHMLHISRSLGSLECGARSFCKI